MSLTYEKQKVMQSVLVAANCDRCNEHISVENGMIVDGKQFHYSISWYNKQYPCGDMKAVVCENCIMEIFHFAQFTGDPC